MDRHTKASGGFAKRRGPRPGVVLGAENLVSEQIQDGSRTGPRSLRLTSSAGNAFALSNTEQAKEAVARMSALAGVSAQN